MIDKNVLKQVKLIVFDLDGTLLNGYNEIGAESIELVKKLEELGVKFSFASGRLHSAIIKHAETLGVRTPLISLDGAIIKSYPENTIVSETYVKPKHVRKAIEIADRLLLNIALCHDEAIYYTEHNSVIPQVMEKFGAAYKEVESYDNYMNRTLEVVITGDYKDSVKYAYKKFNFPYSWGLNTSYYKSHTHGDLYYLEIRRSKIDKGTGLKRLCKYLGVKIRETAVLGDWYNDRTLFETDAVKIALANAVPEIKRMADHITKRTNNEDGAAEFLKMVYQSKTGRL